MASSPRIDELKKKFDENPRRYFAPLANEYRKSGDLEQAIQLCRAYLPQQPGHMSGHIVFGQALFESGEHDEAKSVFETALGLDPENLIALRHLGDIARQGGDHTGARAWYQRVLDADPRNEEIAGQIATLDAAAPPPAATASPQDGGMGSWGDINPERAASEKPTVESPKIPEAQISRAASAPSGAAAQPAPTAPAPRAPAARVVAEFEREGEGDFAPPSPESAAARGGIEGVERSEEIDLRGGDARTAPPVTQSFGSANEFGFEVMEFVPPSREQTPRSVEAVNPGFGVPFTGEQNTEETPAAFVTETMAELYLQQGFVQEALGVYRQLLAKNPKDAGLRDRVSALEKGARSSVSVAAVSDEVVEHAQQRRQSRESGPPTVRAFFAALMRRRVLHRYEDAQDDVPSAEVALAAATANLPMMDVYDTRPAAAGPAVVEAAEPQDDAFIVPDGAVAPPGVAHEEPAQAASSSSEPAWLAQATKAEAAPAPQAAAPAPAPQSRAPEPRAVPPEPSTIDNLFPGAGVASGDDEAAQALSGAFPTVEGTPIAGRPAERAKDELSLDNVFREAERRTGRASGSFSFDQFFAEGSAPAAAAPAPQRSTDPTVASVGGPELSPDDDVAQFNDWLSGLKKK
jgi:tetratricopeptide (TPR) repeat protein